MNLNNHHHKKKKKKKRWTLMNFAKAENYWPTFKSNEQATALKEYQIKLYKDKKEAVNYLERIKRRQLLDMGN